MENKKVFEVEYKKSKVSYTAETLEKHTFEHGIPVLEDDHDYLAAAVRWFCHTHFMYAGGAHLKQYDAETRGRKFQEWEYRPNGNFKGLICARVLAND
jgi:hypothetical protein